MGKKVRFVFHGEFTPWFQPHEWTRYEINGSLLFLYKYGQVAAICNLDHLDFLEIADEIDEKE